jgi:hypothetical protein
MRTRSLIAHFPRLGVAVLGSALLSSFITNAAFAAPAAPAAASAPAGAPDAATKKAAREAYGAGEKAYAAGDYKTAYADFEKAHNLIPTIHASYWMAMASSYGSDTPAAYDALAAVVGSPDAQKLGEEKLGLATARLAELKKTPATVKVTSTPAGAEVSVDGAAQPGVTPSTLSLNAGTHHLGVGLAGYEAYETDLTVKPGQTLDQPVDLKASAPAPAPVAAAAVPAAAPAAAPPPPKEEHSLVPAYVTLGVGAAGAIVGTIFGVESLSAKSDFNKTPTNALADKTERDALIADMGFAVAITLGITGIVLLTSGDSTSEAAAQNHSAGHAASARLDIAPMVSQHVQGAAARLSF